MRFAACHNPMIKKKGEVDLRIDGKLYLVKNVYYEECSACGEKVLSPEVSQDLFEKIKNKKFVEETLKAPMVSAHA